MTSSAPADSNRVTEGRGREAGGRRAGAAPTPSASSGNPSPAGRHQPGSGSPKDALRAGLLLALLLGSPPALAEPKDDARRHFAAGLEAAGAKDYQRALDEFLAAQEAWPHRATVKNIARSYLDLQRPEKALEYYRLYQEMEPDPVKRGEVEAAIQGLEAQLRPAPAPAPTTPAAPAQASSEDAARLQAIAAELAQLSQRLSAPPAPVEPVEGPAPAPAPPPAPAPAPPEAGALESEAYTRIVVTASRYGQEPLDSPSTITVLSADDIRRSGATNIPDALRRAVGVEVMALSPAKPDVSIRGFNRELSNKVLVLVDGRPVYLDILGTVVWGALGVSLEEIERIEIIRGPGSAIYGANAMTGVINIITRTPGEGSNLVHVEGGHPGYGQGTALLSGREGDTAWRMAAGWHKDGRGSAEALPAEVEGGSPSLTSRAPDQDLALDVIRAQGRLDRSFGGKGLASLTAGYAEGSTEFYVFGALGDYFFPFEAGFLRGDLAWGPLHLRSAYSRVDAEAGAWLDPTSGRSSWTNVDSSVFSLDAEAQGELETGPLQHRLIGGGGYQRKAVDWGYLAEQPIDENHFNAFVQDEARAGPISLVGSLRLDVHPLVPISETISPRGAAVWRLRDKTSLRLSAGTAYRAPAQMESYAEVELPTGTEGVFVTIKGDEGLSPERIFTAEAGLHDESTSWHVADATVYYNRVRDLIYVTDVVAAFEAFDPANNGFNAGHTYFANLDPTYSGYGLELDGRLFPADGVDIFCNLALERVVESSEGESIVDRSASAAKVNAGLAWRSPYRLDLSAEGYYSSAQTWRLRDYNAEGQLVVTEESIPARIIPVLRLAGRPLPEGRLELSAVAWNLPALFSDQAWVREHPKGQLLPGRLYGAAEWSF